MHDLQAEMHNKRREAYEHEDKLGTDNPAVFATVQVRLCAVWTGLDLLTACHQQQRKHGLRRVWDMHQQAAISNTALCGNLSLLLLLTHPCCCHLVHLHTDVKAHPAGTDQALPGAAQEGLQVINQQSIDDVCTRMFPGCKSTSSHVSLVPSGADWAPHSRCCTRPHPDRFTSLLLRPVYLPPVLCCAAQVPDGVQLEAPALPDGAAAG